jgi:hypothetical protein
MRNGLNPGKIHPQLSAFKRHRVIIPVYVPTLDGYFAHALEILRLGLESLWLTAGTRASVTVSSNECTHEVVDALHRWAAQGWIDQLVLNTSNRGKVDAVTAVARGAFEELITIADGDVMFMPGWMQAIEDLFIHFPECGFVAPCPNPVASLSCTSATILGALASGELGYQKVVADEDLDRFAHSIGRADWFKPEHRRAQTIVQRGGVTACVGGGHFVFTIRKELVDTIPKLPSLQALKVGGEHVWLDEPPDKAGVWKLATPRAFAYHLGNTPEPWMYDELEVCRAAGPEPPRDLALPALRRRWASRLPWALRSRFAYRMLELHRHWTTRQRALVAPLDPATAPIRGRATEDFEPYRGEGPRP